MDAGCLLTINQLEWMAIAAYDRLDSEQICAVDYGISVVAELFDAIERIGGYRPVVEKILAEKCNQYINDVMEMIK